ncbi:putative adipose-regulatory protein-domain-containing protein [Pavlovales sp. CCMP2436]|nr:putative adipose-regulatory protein-domain-containing protein [Pavlovales sp. CCMP2436]
MAPTAAPPPRMDWDAVALWGERVVTYSVRFWMLFVLASTSAISAYLMVYRSVVPDASHVRALHFYFADGVEPMAEAALGEVAMAPGHAYALSLCLEMPESEPNQLAGNFMVELSVHAWNNETLLATRRPAILRYRSGLVHALWTVAALPLLLIGRAEERQTLRIPLHELFDNPRKTPAAWARVRLSKPALQVYSAELRVDAIFRGLSYYMHTYRFATALVSVSAVVFVQFVLLAMLQFRGRAAPPNIAGGAVGDRGLDPRGSGDAGLSSGDESPLPPSGARRRPPR